VDPDLWLHLKTINFLPEMCFLRWLRTLFSRDLPIEEALCAWDYFLADIDYNLL